VVHTFIHKGLRILYSEAKEEKRRYVFSRTAVKEKGRKEFILTDLVMKTGKVAQSYGTIISGFTPVGVTTTSHFSVPGINLFILSKQLFFMSCFVTPIVTCDVRMGGP